jgi:uncharacterized protein
VRFEWDEEKNRINRGKHSVSFEIAVRIFEDPNVLQFVERVEGGEERWHAIGLISGSLLFLTVVHTYADDPQEPIVRIISARRATSHERRLYAEAIL